MPRGVLVWPRPLRGVDAPPAAAVRAPLLEGPAAATEPRRPCGCGQGKTPEQDVAQLIGNADAESADV
jgi:hypothetical protein